MRITCYDGVFYIDYDDVFFKVKNANDKKVYEDLRKFTEKFDIAIIINQKMVGK